MVFCHWLPSLRMTFSRFTHVLACTSTWILFWPTMDIPHYDGCWAIHHYQVLTLRSFPLSAIMNDSAMDFYVQVLCEHMFSILSGIYWRVKLLDHMVTFCSIFWGTAKLLSKMAGALYTPTGHAQRFHFLHIPPTLVIVSLIHCNFLIGCEVASHCGLPSHS